MTHTINPQTALIYIMVTTSAVDRRMDDAELSQMGSIVRHLPIFSNFNEEMMIPAAQDCAGILSSDEGLETILGLVEEALPEELYETAYAVAVDIAAANLELTQEELRFLQMLRRRLHIDKLVVAAIERGASARHRTLPKE